MWLREVSKGVHSGADLNTENSLGLVIAVHPYYTWLYRQDEAVSPSRDYIKGIDNIVKTHQGPIITLEDTKHLSETAERYGFLGRKKDRYFVPTNPADPQPAEISWEELFTFIRRFPNGDSSITLIGGYFWEQGRSGSPGCLGTTLAKLKEGGFDVDLDKSLIYT